MGHQQKKIAIQCKSSQEMANALLHVWSSGDIAVPLNWRSTASQTQQMLDIASCTSVICDRNKNSYGNKSFSDFDLTPLISDESLFSDIIFTSGSTGKPKGVVHSFSNHYYSAIGSHENIPFCKGDTWLMSLPLYHVGGLSLLFRSMLHGGDLLFPCESETLEETITNNDVLTHISLVPAQLINLLKSQQCIEKLQQYKAVLVGGAVFSPALRKQCHELGLPIFATYGSSEMSSQITTTKRGKAGLDLHSSGHVLPDRQLMISKEDEILVKGKTLFTGYFDNQKSNVIQSATDSDGWFHTGDCGCVENHNLYVTGRKDTMFISGGENIYPEEIESALLSFPQITSAVVVPVDSTEYGQRPVAFITKTENLSLESLQAHLLTMIESFKVPDHFLDYENKEESLKPDRTALQQKAELFVTSLDAD